MNTTQIAPQIEKQHAFVAVLDDIGMQERNPTNGVQKATIANGIVGKLRAQYGLKIEYVATMAEGVSWLRENALYGGKLFFVCDSPTALDLTAQLYQARRK